MVLVSTSKLCSARRWPTIHDRLPVTYHDDLSPIHARLDHHARDEVASPDTNLVDWRQRQVRPLVRHAAPQLSMSSQLPKRRSQSWRRPDRSATPIRCVFAPPRVVDKGRYLSLL